MSVPYKIKIRRFNEGISNLKYESFDFFDITVEKLKNYKGWTVFYISKEDQYCQVFNFANKEDFDRNFSINKHPHYPGNMVAPNNVEETEQGNSDRCIIDGQEFYLETLELYLIIDGKLMR